VAELEQAVYEKREPQHGEEPANAKAFVGRPTESDEDHHADLKGIALTLSLFQNLLVKEVKMKGHWLFSVRDIRMPPHKRH